MAAQDINKIVTVKRGINLVENFFIVEKTAQQFKSGEVTELLKQPVTIDENGTNVKIRTVGDRWSLLQRYKFGANAQPFYVIVDSKGRLLRGPYTFDPDADRFLEFISSPF